MANVKPVQEIVDASRAEEPEKESCTFICSRDTLEGVYPPLILAINARRMGMDVAIFFTFMGLNVVRKGGIQKVQFIPQGTMGAIPGMASIATRMMRKQIDEADIPAIEDLLEIAQLEGIKFIACKMTIDMMKMKTVDLIDGVEVQTAEQYLKYARTCKINMFT